MRRMPPNKVEQNLTALLEIVPDHIQEDLLSSVDQPLQQRLCKQTGREYLLCDYNRDGDSWRSPWSNTYDPPIGEPGEDNDSEDAVFPSENLRKFEIAANGAFDTYRDLYFEGGCSSVYAWDLDVGFAVCVLIQKKSSSSIAGAAVNGSWDSIHVLEVVENSSRSSARYKLTSTVLLYTQTENAKTTGKVDLSGSLTRQVEQDCPLTGSGEPDLISAHIGNIGRMIEDMEFKIRHALQEIYFGKTKDILNDLRSVQSLADKRKQDDMQRELAQKLTSGGGISKSPTKEVSAEKVVTESSPSKSATVEVEKQPEVIENVE